jgi:hypothetical protein
LSHSCFQRPSNHGFAVVVESIEVEMRVGVDEGKGHDAKIGTGEWVLGSGYWVRGTGYEVLVCRDFLGGNR